MLTLPSSVRVYLAAEPVDLRRGHDGLVGIVRSTWQLNPYDGHLFVLGRPDAYPIALGSPDPIEVGSAYSADGDGWTRGENPDDTHPQEGEAQAPALPR